MNTTITKTIKHALVIKPDAIRRIWEIFVQNGYESLRVTAYCNDEIQFKSNLDEFLAFDNSDDRKIRSFAIEGSKNITETVFFGVGDGVHGKLFSTATLRISTSDDKAGLYMREQILRIIGDCKPGYSVAARTPVVFVLALLLFFYSVVSIIKAVLVRPLATYALPIGWSFSAMLAVASFVLLFAGTVCHLVLDSLQKRIFPSIVLLVGKQADNHNDMYAWRIGVGGSLVASAIGFVVWEILRLLSIVGET